LSGGFTFDDSEAGFGDFEVGGEKLEDRFVGFTFVWGGCGVDRKMRVI